MIGPSFQSPLMSVTTAPRGLFPAPLSVGGGRPLWIEFEGARVDAIAHPGRARTVRKHVAEMRSALLADDFGPLHEQAVVGAQLDVLGGGRLGETGPAR